MPILALTAFSWPANLSSIATANFTTKRRRPGYRRVNSLALASALEEAETQKAESRKAPRVKIYTFSI